MFHEGFLDAWKRSVEKSPSNDARRDACTAPDVTLGSPPTGQRLETDVFAAGRDRCV